jgi:hypothetical protein
MKNPLLVLNKGSVAASPTKQIEATLTVALGEASLQSPCSTPTAVKKTFISITCLSY